MKKPVNNTNSVALLAAALTLAACGKAELPAASEKEAPARVAETTPTEDAADANLPTIVEHRHFAIYKTYRMLFDDNPGVVQAQPRIQAEGLQHAVAHAGEGLYACSTHAILLED